MKAVAGRPLGLECVARGHPPPTLSWHHEGLPVAESNGTWLEAGGSVLSLESLGEASGGLYSCVASSPAGEAVLQYAVDVQGEPGPPRLSHAGRGPLLAHLPWACFCSPFSALLLVHGLDAFPELPGGWRLGGGQWFCRLPFDRRSLGASSGLARAELGQGRGQGGRGPEPWVWG